MTENSYSRAVHVLGRRPMVNRVAGCQPPARATPFLRFGSPSLPGVVKMMLALGSALGKHPFCAVCGCGPGCRACGGCGALAGVPCLLAVVVVRGWVARMVGLAPALGVGCWAGVGVRGECRVVVHHRWSGVLLCFALLRCVLCCVAPVRACSSWCVLCAPLVCPDQTTSSVTSWPQALPKF